MDQNSTLRSASPVPPLSAEASGGHVVPLPALLGANGSSSPRGSARAVDRSQGVNLSASTDDIPGPGPAAGMGMGMGGAVTGSGAAMFGVAPDVQTLDPGPGSRAMGVPPNRFAVGISMSGAGTFVTGPGSAAGAGAGPGSFLAASAGAPPASRGAQGVGGVGGSAGGRRPGGGAPVPGPGPGSVGNGLGAGSMRGGGAGGGGGWRGTALGPLPGSSRSRSPGTADVGANGRRVVVSAGPLPPTPGLVSPGGSPAPVPQGSDVQPFRPNTSSMRPPVFAKYSWEPEYQRALLDAALRLPPEAVPAGFMATLSSTLPPATEAPALEPDTASLRWFKSTYPDAISTTRRDVLAIRLWLDEQFQQLRRHVVGPEPRPQSAPNSALAAAAAAAASRGAAAANGAPNSPPRQPGGPPASPDRGRVGTSGTSAASMAAAAADAAAAAAACGLAAHFLGPDSLMLIRDAEGYLDGAVLRHQETLLSRCMSELVGQVATLCVERGHLLSMLWHSLRHGLYALLADRDAARATALAARRQAASATSEKADVLGRVEAEKADMTNMNDLLNRRLLAAKMEAEHVRSRHADVEAELARLRAVQPDELRRELDSMKVQMSTLERTLIATQVRLERAQNELLDREKDLAAAVAKVQGMADELNTMRDEFWSRSPRPAQPRQPPWELLQADEAALTLTGLRTCTDCCWACPPPAPTCCPGASCSAAAATSTPAARRPTPPRPPLEQRTAAARCHPAQAAAVMPLTGPQAPT